MTLSASKNLSMIKALEGHFFESYFLKATSRLFGKACLIPIGNHRWYIFLDIQLRFSYIQLTQKRVLIIYLTF